VLTLEHVKIRRRKGLVEVVPLCGVDDERAIELADGAVDVAKAHEGEARATLEDALDELPAVMQKGSDEPRFARGLKKLVLDACAFDVDTTLDPEAVRAAAFAAAAAARSASAFDRARVIDSVAAAMGTGVDDVERALYADLSAAHAVRGLEVDDGKTLVARYRTAELQAVLLRAVRLVVDVQASSLELRGLLRALKLHQLLFELDVPPDFSLADVGDAGDVVRLTVEGPMSLFQQSTRYGLKLALLLPHIAACARFKLDAHVKLRNGGPLERFVVDGKRAGARADIGALSETAATLLAELEGAERWKARAATEILPLAGEGAVVPDLVLEDKKTGELVYVEVLGFWSRKAVWKRVELVERGLPYRIVFCASERLRVSEEALPDDGSTTSALVVFKGVLRAQKVLEAADRVSAAGSERGNRLARPVR
jgi:predicted nuclease of restriction endonuclease-like RecB superfamily